MNEEPFSPKEYVEWYNKKFKQSISGRGDLSFPQSDQELLISLIKKCNIKTILEFGTYEGCTTNLMYLYPSIENVKTIDWKKGHPSEKYGTYFNKANDVEFVVSNTINWEPNEEQYDLILIDAGHDYEDIKHDTELALKMNPKLIIWHDYPVNLQKIDYKHTKIKKYIDELIENGYHIKFGAERIAWLELKRNNGK